MYVMKMQIKLQSLLIFEIIICGFIGLYFRLSGICEILSAMHYRSRKNTDIVDPNCI